MVQNTPSDSGPIPLWNIRLLGTLSIESASDENRPAITRFRTRYTASLLAYLAYFPQSHPREVLVDLLWPDADMKSGRSRLSLALNALRTQLETDNHGGGSVLLTDSFAVRLNPDLIRTDVLRMENHLAGAHREKPGSVERATLLLAALRLWSGNLLSGLYDSWIVAEQERLADRYYQAARDLALLCRASGTSFPLLAEAVAEVRRAATLRAGQEGADSSAVQTLSDLADEIANKSTGSPPPSVPPAPPPLPLPTARVTRSIPAPLTRFFGRESEIDALKTLLIDQGQRLVTITGTGGVGKTRIALETARRLSQSSFGGRVGVSLLADLQDAEQLSGRICRALGIEPRSQEDPLSALAREISGDPFLLVLDNLEHLNGDIVSDVVLYLLENASQLQILTTSRISLRLMGERAFPVQPFPLPDEGDVSTGDISQTNPCLALLLDRARAVRPDFRISTPNIGIAVRLCQSLEGLPLSIELVAARLSVLSLAQAEEKVRERFELLESNKRDMPKRHRSLRAVLDYSYDLLPSRLREQFVGLSVFRGGWSAEAAEAVCDADLDDLAALCDNSLVVPREMATGMRFGMLETLRYYAQEQDKSAVTRERHRAFFLQLAESAMHHLQGADQISWLDRLEEEMDNFRTILDPEERSEAIGEKLRLATALHRFWMMRGYLREGRRYLEELLHAVPDETLLSFPQWTAAYNAAGILSWTSGEYAQAKNYFVRSLDCLRRSPSETVDSQRDEARALNNLGIVATTQEQFSEARDYYQAALRIYQTIGEDGRAGTVLTNIGAVSLYLDDLRAAEEAFDRGLVLLEAQGDHVSIASTLLNQADVSRRQGDIPKAIRQTTRGIGMRRQLADRSTDASALRSATSLFLEANIPLSITQAEQAAVLLGAENQIRKAGDGNLSPTNEARYRDEISVIENTLTESVRLQRWQEGALLSPDEALAYAQHCLEGTLPNP